MSKRENNTLWFAQLNVFFWGPKEGSIEKEYSEAVKDAKNHYGPFCLSDPENMACAEELIGNIPGDDMDCQMVYGKPPKSLEGLDISELLERFSGVEKYITHKGRRYKLID